jgi:hypothetical protein
VSTDTKDNVITLTGHVRTSAEHDAVVDAAWMAIGGHRHPRQPPIHRLTGTASRGELDGLGSGDVGVSVAELLTGRSLEPQAPP